MGKGSKSTHLETLFAKKFVHVFEFFMPLIEEPVDRLLALLLGGHALPVASQAELHTHLATTRGRSRIARALSQRRQGARLPDVAFAQLCGMLDFTMTHAGIAHGKFLVPPPRSPPVSRSDPSDNDDGHVGSSADTAAAGAGADASVSNSQLFLATDAPAEPEPDWDDPAVAYWEDVRTLRSLLTMSGTFELDHAGPSGNADAAARYEKDRNTKNGETWRKKNPPSSHPNAHSLFKPILSHHAHSGGDPPPARELVGNHTRRHPVWRSADLWSCALDDSVLTAIEDHLSRTSSSEAAIGPDERFGIVFGIVTWYACEVAAHPLVRDTFVDSMLAGHASLLPEEARAQVRTIAGIADTATAEASSASQAEAAPGSVKK
jgi:hypothetical protein